MLNIYSLKDNEILIHAPGNSNKNRIKNDLIWDINNLLTIKFDLYEFFLCKKPFDSIISKPISTFPKRYVAFQKLDNMFIMRTALDDDEINKYRKTLDPFKEMSDDVFKEACCLENVDIEYIAIESIDYLTNFDIESNSIKSFKINMISLFPVYVSMFGAKEVRIIINDRNMIIPIEDIVKRHCVKQF